jgi:hypothetical protein
MNKILLTISIFFFLSCNKNLEKKDCSSDQKTDKKFEMYQMSEMAALMENMYIENEKLKERIKKGDIHKAVMTDKSDNDQFFKDQAALFIKSQELIYKDPKNAKQHFNEGINACVSCHQVKCGGPIPKIKKLYIK